MPVLWLLIDGCIFRISKASMIDNLLIIGFMAKDFSV